jgi:hypothetical protein
MQRERQHQQNGGDSDPRHDSHPNQAHLPLVSHVDSAPNIFSAMRLKTRPKGKWPRLDRVSSPGCDDA